MSFNVLPDQVRVISTGICVCADLILRSVSRNRLTRHALCFLLGSEVVDPLLMLITLSKRHLPANVGDPLRLKRRFLPAPGNAHRYLSCGEQDIPPIKGSLLARYMGHPVDLTITDQVLDQKPIGLTVLPERRLRVD